MPCPYDPVFLDHQLLSSRLGPIKQTHGDKLNVPTCASLPVDDVIIGYGVTLQVKVHLLPSDVEVHFLKVVLELENQEIT